MCGIAGCIENSNAMKSVVQALSKLQNRGYDSAGVCSIIDDHLEIFKTVSTSKKNAIDTVINHPLAKTKCQNTIGHTRWATHGPKTDENAHPHYDNNERFAMVHNGIIENYLDIKNILIKEGHTFYGQTDTEVACKFVSYLCHSSHDIEELNKFVPKISLGYTSMRINVSNPNSLDNTNTTNTFNGLNLNLGVSYNFSEKLFATLQYDFIKLSSDSVAIDSNFNRNVNILKIGFGLRF
jgi:glucosamine--fructose-6-phosphate aminotransferase (isomerizing)